MTFPYDGVYPVSWLIGRTRNLLLGTTRERINMVENQIQTTDTTITFSYGIGTPSPQAISPGDVLGIDDEIMYVWETNVESGSGSTALVQRGMDGTLPVEHSSGVVSYVNPYFSKFEIRNTLMDEIRSWGPDVFQVTSFDLSTTDYVDGYDMGPLGNWYYVIEVRISPDTLVGDPDDKSWPLLEFDVIRSANVADFPSGNALIITSPGGIFDSPRTIHVVYAAAFDVDGGFNDTDDLVANVGLDTSDVDIPAYGAAWRLLSGRLVRRGLYEPLGSSSDEAQFPAQGIALSVEELKKTRDGRLMQAKIRLRTQFPIRRQ